MSTYEAYRYAAEGNAGDIYPANPDRNDRAVIARGTIEDCRMAIHRLIEGSADASRWAGDEGDLEAYHESETSGCGGWAIRPVSP